MLLGNDPFGDQLPLMVSIDQPVLTRRHQEIQALLRQRASSRQQGDYATSDAIRQRLVAEHVVIHDTPEGMYWGIVEQWDKPRRWLNP